MGFNHDLYRILYRIYCNHELYHISYHIYISYIHIYIHIYKHIYIYIYIYIYICGIYMGNLYVRGLHENRDLAHETWFAGVTHPIWIHSGMI
jgi:hypothetical protein